MVILGHNIFSLFNEKQFFFFLNPQNILYRHTQTSRIYILISAMVTNRPPLNIRSLFIHAAMHDGSHEWVLIGGTKNAMQHALWLMPLLRFTG